MDGEHLPPLHTIVCVSKTTKRVYVYRALTLLRIGATFLLLKYRLANPLDNAFAIWLLVFFCELLFTLNLLLYSICRWRPVERVTSLQRLSSRYERSGEPSKLQPMDIFITSADPLKEPPIVTANTILSVLAADYPVEKISCYVSDDSGSPITFCMMLEVSHFAHKWVTFCNNFSIEPRAPGPFFSNPHILHEGVAVKSDSYLDQWKSLKEEYEQFKNRLESLTNSPEEALKRAKEYIPSWTAPNPTHHAPIVQVITGHQKCQRLPQLVYVAREKRREYNHHFKAGALNALMRVSGILSNSPFILNLDCDMYMNDSKALRHAMCFLMDPNLEYSVGFVQFPQVFDNLGANDVYGNRHIFLYDVGDDYYSGYWSYFVLLKGLDGIQGPLNCGTGCFNRRRVMYGCKPGKPLEGYSRPTPEKYKSRVGPSPLLIKSVLSILDGEAPAKHENNCLSTEVTDLCRCTWEENTSWGRKIGWRYGSNTEDVLTGYHIHCLGWRSIYFWPSRPAFKGVAPWSLADRLGQRKRIGSGVVEMLLIRSSPLFYRNIKRLMFLQKAAYLYVSIFYSGISIFIVLYAALHAASLLSAKPLVPQISDPASIWFVLAICFQHGMSYLDCRWVGVRFEEWWNHERFWFIMNTSSYLFGTVEAFMKSMGIAKTGFTVTPKSDVHENEHLECYPLGDSPLFIPLATMVMVFAVAMLAATSHVAKAGLEIFNNLGGEILFGGWTLVIMFPILRQLLTWPKAIYSLPVSVMLPSVVLTMAFCVMVAVFVR